MGLKVEEWQNEVFIEENEDGSKSLIMLENGENMFYLKPVSFGGRITTERRRKLKSIGTFNVSR